MHCPPLARHTGVAAQAAILCPHDTRFYDIMGLSTFLDFVGLRRVRGKSNYNSLDPSQSFGSRSVLQIIHKSILHTDAERQNMSRFEGSC